MSKSESAPTIYSVRDCHEMDQYDFDSFDKLKLHLSNIYQFDSDINLDGYKVPEFSNIEFLVTDKHFHFAQTVSNKKWVFLNNMRVKMMICIV